MTSPPSPTGCSVLWKPPRRPGTVKKKPPKRVPARLKDSALKIPKTVIFATEVRITICHNIASEPASAARSGRSWEGPAPTDGDQHEKCQRSPAGIARSAHAATGE